MKLRGAPLSVCFAVLLLAMAGSGYPVALG